MIDSIIIELPGQPVPWKAPKVTRRGAYSPARYKAWKAEAALRARLQYEGVEPMTGQIGVEIEVRCKDRRHGDLTNYVKAIEDALQARDGGAGVFMDDKQVVEQRNRLIVDRYNPGVTVRVWRVEGDTSG